MNQPTNCAVNVPTIAGSPGFPVSPRKGSGSHVGHAVIINAAGEPRICASCAMLRISRVCNIRRRRCNFPAASPRPRLRTQLPQSAVSPYILNR